MLFDYAIAGSGLFGAVFAYEAKKAGKSVIVFDEREHIGGNIYTENRQGINVHVFGPHIFHCNSKTIWDYVQQFAEFNNFTNRIKAIAKDGHLYSMPINMNTLNQVFGVTTPAEAKACLEKEVLPFKMAQDNLESWALSQVGPSLYNLLIKGYTKKQWAREPIDLPSSIIKRLPIRLTYNDNYYNDAYQGIPKGGYTQIIQNMLDGSRVELGVKIKYDTNWQSYAKRLVFTGRIDEFFNYDLGDLEYRTQDFEHETLEGDFQGNAIINYTDESVPYTRIVEHKHFEFGTQQNTIITKEYPRPWSREKTPYYPINDAKNNALHNNYMQKLANHPSIIGGGRLFDYRYWDMDQVIARALHIATQEFGCGKRLI